MPVRNQNWYNLQSTRRYPLDDKSTGVDDAGAFIRDDILVDCHIRFPETLGNYLYVQGITVSANLITIVFGAAETLTSTDNPTVAAISVSKPAAANVHYAVEALQDGVSGWVVFGPGVDTNFTGRYTTPAQTYIGLRNARPYRPLPIPTLGKIDLGTSLSGLVRLTATPPVTATYIDETLLASDQRLPKYDPQTQTTNFEPVRAILFSTEAPNIAFNPLTYFLGPCGQRPESGTCPKTPIERINGLQPDCATGNINIVGGNGLTVRTFAECGGLDVTTPLGLEESCAPDREKGKQPKDNCPCDDPYNKTDYYCWPPFTRDGAICEENSEPCPALPICVSFSPCHEPLFEIVSGSFSVATALAPPVCCPPEPGITSHEIYAATRPGSTNIALYRGCASDWAFNHTISVEVQPRSAGARQNGGVVANYMRVTEGGRCKTKYIAAIVDLGASELQIYRFDGSVLIKEAGLNVTTDTTHWYKLSVTAASAGTATAITAALYDITAGTQIASLVTNVEDYEAVNGRAGLFTNNSAAYFNKFEVV